MRTDISRLAFAALVMSACASPAPVAKTATFDPQDPAVAAVLDSIVALSRDGANNADADAAMAPLNADDQLTYVGADLILTGKERILSAFRDTYAQVRRQAYAPIGRQVRLIAPDIAIYSGIGKGSYQDKEGNVSDPVYIGMSGVFVRRDGVWRLVHLQQTFQQ
jgi:uncharacterized protein (TIGR02246 family)